jgi:hypothetical protein
MVKRTLAKSFVLALLIAAGLPAYADPIVITEADFSGAETVIDFNSISNGQSINSQYSASNVVFPVRYSVSPTPVIRTCSMAAPSRPTGFTGPAPRIKD